MFNRVLNTPLWTNWYFKISWQALHRPSLKYEAWRQARIEISQKTFTIYIKSFSSKTTSLQFLTSSHGFKVEPGLTKTSDFSEYIFWSSWSTKQVNEITISKILFGQGISLSNFSPFNTCCPQKKHIFKKICSLKLQVWLNRCDLIADTRRNNVNSTEEKCV